MNQFFSVLLTLAYIELPILKERYEFGTEIYNENNTQVWLDELRNKEKKYSNDLENLYKEWQKWRKYYSLFVDFLYIELIVFFQI